MKSTKSDLGHAGGHSEDEVDKELRRLNRRTIAMINDEPSISHNLKIVLEKQNQIKHHLDQEKINLNDKLEGLKSKKTVADAKKKAMLFSEYKSLVSKIESRRNGVQDLETQIKLVEKAKDKRDRALKIKNADKGEKKLAESSENKLNTEQTKLGDGIAKNRGSRSQMDHLLTMKSRSSHILQNLLHKHESGKKVINDLIEQSVKNYDQKEEAANKIKSALSKDKQSSLNNCREMSEVMCEVDHLSKFNAFMRKKVQKRINEQAQLEKLQHLERHKRSMEENYEKYTQLLDDLKERFGEGDVDRLIVELAKLDGDNYNMYTFNNDVNRKLDDMESELQSLQQEIAQTKQKHFTQQLEQSNQNELLCSQVDLKTRESQSLHEQLIDSKQNVSSILKGIQELVQITSSDTSHLKKMLGKQTNNATTSNFHDFLQSAEQRVLDMEIVSSYTMQRTLPKKQRTLPSVVSFSVKSGPQFETRLPKTPCPLCAELRDISTVDQSIVEPLEVEMIKKQFEEEQFIMGRADLLHSIADCHLPKSRSIIQKGIQN